jgi:hypothetical protein
MTKNEAIKLAISALQNHTRMTRPVTATEIVLEELKAELAKPEPVPVCWASDIAIADRALSHVFSVYRNFHEGMVPLILKDAWK